MRKKKLSLSPMPLQYNDEVYFEELVLPLESAVESKALDLGAGGQNSSFEIVVAVADGKPVTIAAGKKLTVDIQHADADDAAGYSSLFKQEFEAGSYADDMELVNFVPASDAKEWTRIVVTTDDATAAGTVLAYPRIVPR